MKNKNLKGIAIGLALSIFTFGSSIAQSFSEAFNDITTLAGNGWVMTNASVAVGSTNWFQGNPVSAGGPFDAYNGATNAYIGANYNNTGSTGTISNWLMTPNRTFRNGDVITFYTRKVSPDTYADRLEVRLSTNGASTNVGTGAAVGDYTTLLLSVNPSLVLGVYPTSWTLYTITISGLPAPTSGRMAFRYFVTGAGFSGTSSDYIGIDQVNYTPYVCPAFTMTAGGALTGSTAGSAYSTTLTQTGALGTPNYAVTAGALPPGLTLSASGTISGTPTATGTFNFTVTVNDASGCSGSQAYSITTVCPANPLTLTGLPTLCSNNSPVTLTQGSPAGGTYSGTGVSGGMFDPAAGTQTITYDYTDPYGCAFSTSNPITVNMPPMVMLPPLSPACDNAGSVTLTGGSPAGGTYSGTGVSGGSFDPMSGTQPITYTYTDVNGCTSSTNQTLTVNTSPTVTLNSFTAVCDNAGTTALTGESPAGGTFSGTGVTGSNFDPASGTQTINYTYTDANGCSNSANQTFTVNTAPTVTLSSFTAVCSNAGTIALTGEAPAGGTFSGTGVTGSNFNPASGTQTINYTYTDGNGCTNTASQTFNVNTAPTVTLGLAVSDMCIYNSAIVLSGGSPASGVYTGNGVSGGSFDPATAGLGNSTITYTFMDGNGCQNIATDMINVDECLSLSEESSTIISVYPNPTTGLFTIDGLTANTSVKMLDAQGRAIQFTQSNNSIDISKMPVGVYLLVLNNNSTTKVIRLVKN